MPNFKESVSALRAETMLLERATRALMKHDVFNNHPPLPDEQGEMRANIMLAVRHLEDARMRMGKAIQWSEGGTSIFDKSSSHTPVPASA